MPTIETTKSKSAFKRVLLIFISLILVTVSLLGVTTAFSAGELFAGNRPTNIGILSEQLAPCPSTSNCVSSHSDDEHKIEPFTYDSSKPEAMANLKSVLQSFKRAKVITQTENYLYAEFTIPIVGFVDDVEFLVDKNGTIQVRSASRLGESDLGVNRRRIETLRAKLRELKNNTLNQT